MEASDWALELLDNLERREDGKDGHGENTGMIIPRPNSRTYMTSMTAVSRSSLSSLGSSLLGGGDCGKNRDNSDDNHDVYDVIICRSLLT